MIPDAIRALFSPEPGAVYLDAGTYGLPPQPTVQAMRQALDAWQAGTADWVRSWDQHGETCRALFASLIGARPETVSLAPSVSVPVGVVASALRPGDEVVVPDDEFTSVLFPLLVAQQHRGIGVRAVPFDRLVESVRPGTRLVAFSLVQSQSGRTAPLARVCAAAKAAGAQTLVDATHAVPFVPVAPSLGEIDYLVCAAYKHLLCPRGVAFFYVAPAHWDELPAVCASWRGASSPYGRYYGGPLDLAPNAARYDVSLAWLSWVGASESLRLLCEWQRQGVLPEVLHLTRRLATSVGLPATGSSVLSVPVAEADQVRLALEREGIRAAVRAGGVRFSPHVYNTPAEVDRATQAIAPFVAPALYTPRHPVPATWPD